MTENYKQVSVLQLQWELKKKQNLTLQENDRKLADAEAAKSDLQKQLDELKTKLKQSNSDENYLKEQLDSKESILQSNNKTQEELQTTVDELTKTV